ncbi:MAG: hypothetical protein A2849_01760 [Candidatus Taylorbacteria bacterium RIFCSPHIGHO2_01_FULL_51_15]|uniref:Uncharacterized protein n=1 Tax=Candidatus Taylorbacteria bacterium RIFCSPHIGHO2_01_FULL_51_15 TaxID=1802304 RepID=A0A1G2MAR6_9BACT|nr:MAG: hypothetical protein A2849_01760 [Candidatus Taylorbacteria bacterium RIFCSPHIGHO2_01_FULL_51_15]
MNLRRTQIDGFIHDHVRTSTLVPAFPPELFGCAKGPPEMSLKTGERVFVERVIPPRNLRGCDGRPVAVLTTNSRHSLWNREVREVLPRCHIAFLSFRQVRLALLQRESGQDTPVLFEVVTEMSVAPALITDYC